MKLISLLLLILTFSLKNLVNGLQYECLTSITNINDEDVIISNLEETLENLSNNDDFQNTLSANPVESDKYHFHYAKCAEILIRSGYYKATESLIQIAAELGINLSEDIKMIGNQIKRDIDALILFASSKRQIQTVVPVFQWAQNRDHIVMQVKFAHRHDSPGCLDTKNAEVIFESTYLYLSAFCTQSNNPLHFVLNISLHENIDPAKSLWKIESVGRLFINMTKVTPIIWEKLLLDSYRHPQMKIWWEIKDQELYKKDMETFSIMLEEAEEKEACMKNKKCRRKKEAQKKPNIQANNVIVDGRRVDGDDLSKFINIGQKHFLQFNDI